MRRAFFFRHVRGRKGEANLIFGSLPRLARFGTLTPWRGFRAVQLTFSIGVQDFRGLRSHGCTVDTTSCTSRLATYTRNKARTVDQVDMANQGATGLPARLAWDLNLYIFQAESCLQKTESSTSNYICTTYTTDERVTRALPWLTMCWTTSLGPVEAKHSS